MPHPSTPASRRDLRTPTFESLYHDYYAFVWRCLYRLGVRTETEDATQEVFITAYRRLHTFEGRSSIRGWLAGIARRIAFRVRRTTERRRRRRHAQVSRPPTSGDDIEQRIRCKEAGVFLNAFVDRLHPDKRGMFVLVELEGLQGREAAKALGLNPNTAYSRLRAARAAFERACASAHGDVRPQVTAQILQAREQSPPPRAIQRGWMAFVSRTGYLQLTTSTIAAPTVPGWMLGATKLGGLLLVFGGATWRIAPVAHDGSRPTEPSVSVAHTETSRPSPRNRPSTGLDPAPPPSAPPAPSHQAPVSDLPGTSRAAIRPQPPANIPIAADARVPPSRRRKADPDRRPPPDVGLTGPEYALLRRASTAYGDGRADDATELAESLLDRYPDSFLAPDTRVLLVKAHCVLEQRDRAMVAASGLAPREGNRLLRRYCGVGSRHRGTVETTRG